MPFDQINTKSLASSSVTSDTILDNTIDQTDLKQDLVDKITPYISDTYYNLRALAEQNKLVPGKYYRISDYMTAWWEYTENAYVGPKLSAELITSVQDANAQFALTSNPQMMGRDVWSRMTIMETGDTDWKALGATDPHDRPPWEGMHFLWNGTTPNFKNNATTGTHGKFVPRVLGNPHYSGVVEPLFVLATGTRQFGPIAYSETFPGDIIHYDFWETKSWSRVGYGFQGIPGAKGWITRRIGTLWVGHSKKDSQGNYILDSYGNRIDDQVASQGAYNYGSLDCPYDWRYITWPCRKIDASHIPIWDATTTYKRSDLVRRPGTGLIFQSLRDNNLNAPNFPTSLSGNPSTSFDWSIFFAESAYYSTQQSWNHWPGVSMVIPGKMLMQLPHDEVAINYWGSNTGGVPKYSYWWGLPRMEFNINIYDTNGSTINNFTALWDHSSIAYKPTLAANPDNTDSHFKTSVGSGSNYISHYGNVIYSSSSNFSLGSTTAGQCMFNTVLWGITNVKTGANFSNNYVGYLENVYIGAQSWGNILLGMKNCSTGDSFRSNSCMWLENVTFGNVTYNNFFAQSVARNTFGDTFVNNYISLLFLDNVIGPTNGGNFFSPYFKRNTLGSNCFNNIFKAGGYGNFFDSVANTTIGYMENNKFEYLDNSSFGQAYLNTVSRSKNINITNELKGNTLILVDYGDGSNWLYNHINSGKRIVSSSNSTWQFWGNIMKQFNIFTADNTDADFSNSLIAHNYPIKEYVKMSYYGYPIISYISAPWGGQITQVNEYLKDINGNPIQYGQFYN